MTNTQEQKLSQAIATVRKLIEVSNEDHRRMVQWQEETDGVTCSETREECKRTCARWDKLSEDLESFHSVVMYASPRNHQP